MISGLLKDYICFCTRDEIVECCGGCGPSCDYSWSLVTVLRFMMSVHLSIATVVQTPCLRFPLQTYNDECKSGCSCCVFGEIRNEKLISWASLVAGHALHGKGRGAISLFRDII